MEKEITSYDYKTIRIRRQLEAMVSDAYEALGWEIVGSSVSEGGIYHVNLSFKRNRAIANKTALLKLQEKVDATIVSVEVLLDTRKYAGLTSGITTGVIGTLAFGGGMSMIMELGVDPVHTGWLFGGMALSVVGAAVCFLGWLVGIKVKNAKRNKISPLLEQEYNKLADICDEARKVR